MFGPAKRSAEQFRDAVRRVALLGTQRVSRAVCTYAAKQVRYLVEQQLRWRNAAISRAYFAAKAAMVPLTSFMRASCRRWASNLVIVVPGAFTKAQAACAFQASS